MTARAAALLVIVVLIADRITKTLVVRSMHLGESFDIVPGLLAITYVRNPGAAFGLLAGAPSAWRITFLIVVALAAVGMLGWLFWSLPSAAKWQRAAVATVIGGALGNLLDRILAGEVVDFIDAYVGTWHWPAFNVADSCITVGVCFLVAVSFIVREGPSRSTPVGGHVDPPSS